jgi:hypothetical protein
MDTLCPVFNGMLAIDTMITCNKLVTLDSSARGLDAYAKKIGFSKNDISYFAQLQIFNNGFYTDGDWTYTMEDVADYCN